MHLVLAVGLLSMASTAVGAELVIPANAEAMARSERDQKVNRFLFSFDLPAELQNARVDRAVLRLDVDRSVLTEEAIQLRILPVQEEWTSSRTASLTVLPSANDSVGTSWIIQKADSGFALIDVESIVDDWMCDRYPNRGIVVMPMENPEETMTLREYSGKASIVRAELHISYRQKRDASNSGR